METDKRVETLESEFKLMKGELKQTLSSVRDYLLNLKLPASPEAALLAAAMGEGGSGMVMDGRFSIDKGGAGSELEPGRDESTPGRDELTDEEAAEENESEENESEEDESQEPEAELSEEPEEPMEDEETGKTGVEMNQSTPPVNLLANLIRWISNARRAIGAEQLPIFLEMYGISGHLSPELKEVILHLADIAATEPADASAAEIWSQLILELHGILAGDNSPLYPLRPFWNDGGSDAQLSETDEDEPQHKPLKLKLVLQGSDGKDKEFSLNLDPDAE